MNQFWVGVGVGAYILLFMAAVVGIGVWRRRKHRVRPPLEFKLLRGAGESLRRRVQRFDEEWFFYGVGAALAPILPACVTLFGLAKAAPHMNAAVGLSFTFLAWLLGALASGRWLQGKLFRYSNDHLGYLGERAVAEYLEKLTKEGYLVFHDVPAVGTTAFNLDHVTVGPTGVAVVETKTRRKGRTKHDRAAHKVFYDGKQLIWPWGENRDGLDQVMNNADWLAKWLSDRTGLRLPVKPIVVLPGWWVEMRARGPVTVIDLKHVADAVRGYGEVTLSAEQIDLIGRQLDDRCRDVED